MTGLLTLLGIVMFVVVIAFSIGLHEAGHMFWAKRFGVRVPEFMIGFGPKIWSRRRGETTYGLKAIPAGGYVRLIGMYPPNADGTLRASNTGRFAQLAVQAKEQAAEELLPGDDNRVIYKLAPWKKILVFLGGPVMNLILAFVLFGIVLLGIGLGQSTLTVNQVIPCVVPSTGAAAVPTVTETCPVNAVQTPAAAAGLRQGDELVALNGAPAQDWAQFSTFIREARPGPATVTVVRDGRELTIPFDLTTVERAVLDANGNPTDATSQQPFMGLSPELIYVRQSVTDVPAVVWDTTVASVKALGTFPVKIYELAGTMFTNGERDPDGPVSVVGVSRISGEVIAAEGAWQGRINQFLLLAASINLFLFLFNLVPLLPLDGGHIAGAMYESVRSRIARLRRRPDPGPFDTTKLLPIAYAMTFVLIAVGGLVIAADIFKPLSIF